MGTPKKRQRLKSSAWGIQVSKVSGFGVQGLGSHNADMPGEDPQGSGFCITSFPFRIWSYGSGFRALPERESKASVDMVPK